MSDKQKLDRDELLFASATILAGMLAKDGITSTPYIVESVRVAMELINLIDKETK